MSPRPWRRGWNLPWPLTDDDVAVTHGEMADGELEHPVEDQPSAAGVAAIEAEHEFVQIAVEVRLVRRPLVGAEQPPFGEGGDPVHAGQQFAGIFPASPRRPLATPVVGIALVFLAAELAGRGLVLLYGKLPL